MGSTALFRITVIRLQGAFSSHLRQHVDDLLKRARGTDVLIVDICDAQFDDISAYRFARRRYAADVTTPRVRILTRNATHADVDGIVDGDRVQFLTGVQCYCPGKLPGVVWEELLFNAAEVDGSHSAHVDALLQAIDTSVRRILPRASGESNATHGWHWSGDRCDVRISTGGHISFLEMVREDGTRKAVRTIDFQTCLPDEIALSVVNLLTA